MSDILPKGFTLKTIFGETITIDEYINEGGQGVVYLVNFNGQKKALKWYKKEALGKEPQDFYENLKRNVIRKSPSKEFLWPLEITEWVDGTFGYVMDLRPSGYYELTDFMLTHVRFKSFKTAIDASLQIISAFRILHNAGYSYQDLNDGNFFINPDTGKVLICDNDNVAEDGAETGIIGKPRYMAPEIVMGKNKPNSLSDRFSMTVILYILFCLNHPLEGKRYYVSALDSVRQEKLYGSEPLFMMDPNDQGNGPHPVLNKNSITIWNCLPDYMRALFIKSFSQEALHKPVARPKEIEWIKTLTRFRSEIVECECGNEIFTQNGKPCACDKCGKIAQIPFRLELSEYSIPAVKGSRLYRCQLGVCNEKDALNPILAVIEKKSQPGVFGIVNKTEKHWNAITSKGEPKKVAAGERIPLKDGITFTIEDEKITIRKN